jgi:hypothetical protein
LIFDAEGTGDGVNDISVGHSRCCLAAL